MHDSGGRDLRVIDLTIGEPMHDLGSAAKSRSMHRQDVVGIGDLLQPRFDFIGQIGRAHV